MKYSLLFFLSLFFLTQCTEASPPAESTVEEAPVEAPKSDDEVAIEGVIQNYFNGWLTGDTTLLGSAMHSSCHLKFVRDEGVVVVPRNQYLSNFQPRPRLPNAEGRILDIDIVRTAAEAKVELETEGRLFTDYFNLLKEGDRWYITDKVSTNIAK